MRSSEMTGDQLRAMALECKPDESRKWIGKTPVLPKANCKVHVDSGEWFAYPGKTEMTKRYMKAAKADLQNRRLGIKRETEHETGEFGHVQIGPHWFVYYPKSQMLVREDFARWCDFNWAKVLRTSGAERESTKPLQQETVKVDELLHLWKDIRKRAMELDEPTLLMKPGEWNTRYDMKHTLSRYSLEIAADKKAGCFYPIIKIQADHLAALIAYRERSYNDSVDFFLDMAATAVKTAQWIQKRHSKHETEGGAE